MKKELKNLLNGIKRIGDEMKKVGLLSVYNHNYGTILQAYALQKHLQKMGYENEIIFYKKSKFLQIKRLLYIPLLNSIIRGKFKDIYLKIFYKDIYQKVLMTREDSFKKFIDNHLKFSSIYNGRDELISSCKNYTQFVVGSDQVWHPLNLGSDFFTMNFIPEQFNKVSYASSFGVSEIPSKFLKKYQVFLSRINHISVRESDAIDIVKSISGKNAVQVVDPTLLLSRNDWEEICSKSLFNEKYVFCYFIGNNEEHRDMVKNFASQAGLKIVNIPHVDEFVKSDIDFADESPAFVGLSEFLSLIKNAEYVFTDSFHATVFSLIFRKKFVDVARFKNTSSQSTNSRITSLLKVVNLEDRFLNEGASLNNIINKDIDFEQVEKQLSILKEKSLSFLENSLIK